METDTMISDIAMVGIIFGTLVVSVLVTAVILFNVDRLDDSK